MARRILGDSDRGSRGAGLSGTVGPCMDTKRDVMNYAAPTIPGWDPHASKSPGLGGSVRTAGSQGQQMAYDVTGQGVGIKRAGGEGRGMGTNRKG